MLASAAAREVAAGYDAIFIDEYQDTRCDSGADSEIVSRRRTRMVETENIFMVGDVKQSIYGFRYARPQLFMQKSEDYHMSIRRRKRSFCKRTTAAGGEILEAVNSIFESLMQEACGGIAYSAERALSCQDVRRRNRRRIWRNSDRSWSFSARRKGRQEIRRRTIEAEYAAARMEEMLRHAWKYAVRDGDEFRPLRAGDIAILLRSAKEAGPVLPEGIGAAQYPGFCRC